MSLGNADHDALTKEEWADLKEHESGVGAISGALAGYGIAKSISPSLRAIGPIPQSTIEAAVYCGTIAAMAYAGKKTAETVTSAISR